MGKKKTFMLAVGALLAAGVAIASAGGVKDKGRIIENDAPSGMPVPVELRPAPANLIELRDRLTVKELV
jgi:hypothetical protein